MAGTRQGASRRVQARLTFLEPILDLDVVFSAGPFINIQLIRTIDCDRVLDVAE